MPVANFRCTHLPCANHNVVVERVFLPAVAMAPTCDGCGTQMLMVFSKTSEQDLKDALKTRYNKNRVRSPALGATQYPRRAFDPKSTPEDLITDLRTGDIYM